MLEKWGSNRGGEESLPTFSKQSFLFAAGGIRAASPD